MRAAALIIAGLLFLGMADLPSGYYTFLRIVVTIGAIGIVYNQYSGSIDFWIILFGVIAILFNPVIPVYFYEKGVWMVIDGIAGFLFLIKSFALQKP